jgi:hypothetical protein
MEPWSEWIRSLIHDSVDAERIRFRPFSIRGTYSSGSVWRGDASP